MTPLELKIMALKASGRGAPRWISRLRNLPGVLDLFLPPEVRSEDDSYRRGRFLVGASFALALAFLALLIVRFAFSEVSIWDGLGVGTGILIFAGLPLFVRFTSLLDAAGLAIPLTSLGVLASMAQDVWISAGALFLGAFFWFYDHERRRAEKTHRRAKEKAVRASRTKSLFLANMSHEIRTPMSGILGMSDLLRKLALDREAREYAETIGSSAEKLLRIIDDILDFSKIEADKLELEEIDFLLEETVSEAVDLLAPRAHAKGLRLRLRFADYLPLWLSGDPARLSQVLFNLIGNAIKFTPDGKVDVSVAEQGIEGQEIILSFTVRDTGIGISDEARERLFTPFTQGDNTVTRRFGGTGLGLVICQRIVESMGGKIQVESDFGRGSTFSFTARFRLSSGLGQQMSSNVVLLEPLGRRGRILLAEDDPINRLVAVKQLEGLGLDVDVASNGFEVLEAVGETDYDVVLMDCQMPKLDGYETCRRLRERERRYVPVVAVTAHAMPGDREKCIAAGMDDYISKPYREKEMRTALDRWILMPEPGAIERFEEASEKHAEHSAALDSSRLEILHRLNALKAVGEAFLEDMPVLFNRVREALEIGDADTAEQAAHRMKGSSANLGARRLSALLKELENLVRDGDLEAAQAKLEEAAEELAKVEIELNEALEARPS